MGTSKFHDWKHRFGKVNEHNAWVPRDHWLTDEEKQRICAFARAHPLEGYRQLTFMMLDANEVACSPSSVYRVLKAAGLLAGPSPAFTKKGTGFVQPLQPHEHWHVDVSYLNITRTFYFLCSILDGCSRFIVHWEIRENATVAGFGFEPTGTVTFLDGNFVLGTAPLINGVATLTISRLLVGNKLLTAIYSGDEHFDSSTSSLLVLSLFLIPLPAAPTAAAHQDNSLQLPSSVRGGAPLFSDLPPLVNPAPGTLQSSSEGMEGPAALEAAPAESEISPPSLLGPRSAAG
jgi:hypothetical protein